MNEIIKALCERKSVRVYLDTPITQKEKAEILRCAVNAPSAGNQQLYTILDITSVKQREKLAVLCDNQAFIAKAAMVLIFCADPQKWYNAYKQAGCEPRLQGVGDLLLSVADSFVAAQNAVTAADSLGIGSCYIGDILENCEAVRELLALPQGVLPCAMLTFGYPTKGQISRKKPQRCPMQYIVHENTYDTLTAQETRAMLEYKAGNKDYEQYISEFCMRKYNSDFSREMTRSVEEYLKYFATDSKAEALK